MMGGSTTTYLGHNFADEAGVQGLSHHSHLIFTTRRNIAHLKEMAFGISKYTWAVLAY